MAQAVLKIQLPLSPAQIQSLINYINNLLTNGTKFSDDLKNMDKQAKAAQDMQQKAQETKSVSENQNSVLCKHQRFHSKPLT